MMVYTNNSTLGIYDIHGLTNTVDKYHYQVRKIIAT